MVRLAAKTVGVISQIMAAVKRSVLICFIVATYRFIVFAVDSISSDVVTALEFSS